MARLISSCTLVLLLVALISAFAFEISYAGGEGSLKPEQCGGACDYRCSKTHHKSACIEFCNYCCERCLCVPSGTYGHREECPCYNNIKTKEGANKCP